MSHRRYFTSTNQLGPSCRGENSKLLKKSSLEANLNLGLFDSSVRSNAKEVCFLLPCRWLVFSDPGFQGMLAVLETGVFPYPESWGFPSPFIGSLRPLKMVCAFCCCCCFCLYLARSLNPQSQNVDFFCDSSTQGIKILPMTRV